MVAGEALKMLSHNIVSDQERVTAAVFSQSLSGADKLGGGVQSLFSRLHHHGGCDYLRPFSHARLVSGVSSCEMRQALGELLI